VHTLLTFKTLQQTSVPNSETERISVSRKKPLKSTAAQQKHLSFQAPTATFDDREGVYVTNETFGFTYRHDVSFGMFQPEY
jgi:hypothetical protein